MDRLFDVGFPALGPGFFNELEGQFPIDVYQEKDALVVRAEVPGFRKEDLAVEVADGVLTITAQQKTEAKEGSEAATTARKVSRAVSLPEHLALDKIEAAYENGVLTVKLPKSEEVKPKQIAVEVK
jgi:HSP20 family protein